MCVCKFGRVCACECVSVVSVCACECAWVCECMRVSG